MKRYPAVVPSPFEVVIKAHPFDSMQRLTISPVGYTLRMAIALQKRRTGNTGERVEMRVRA